MGPVSTRMVGPRRRDMPSPKCPAGITGHSARGGRARRTRAGSRCWLTEGSMPTVRCDGVRAPSQLRALPLSLATSDPEEFAWRDDGRSRRRMLWRLIIALAMRRLVRRRK